MIQAATRTLDVAEFYVSDAPGSRLEPVIVAIEAAAHRGVAVRLLVDAGFSKGTRRSSRLGAVPGIVLASFDVHPVMGGVLHAKYFIVDGRETYLGSQNFDGRSLAHIHEIGVRIRDAVATAAYARVFALDWDLAAGAPSTVGRPRRPGAYALARDGGGRPGHAMPVASPRGFLPDPRTWELPRLVLLIDGAKQSVHAQVLTYDTRSRDGSPFPDLDDALRRAAARGVSLLVSDRDKKKGMVEAVQKLVQVPGVQVRFIDVPPWSGASCPSPASPTPSTWWSTASAPGWAPATGRVTTSRRPATSASSWRARPSRRSSTASSTTPSRPVHGDRGPRPHL